jgi:hypothetical protein
MDYHQKYLKYKMKYLQLKNQYGYGKHRLQEEEDDENEEENGEVNVKINEFLTNLVTLNYENIDENKAQIEKLLNEIDINLLNEYKYTEIKDEEINERKIIPLIVLIKLYGTFDDEIYKDLLRLFRQKIDVTDKNKELMIEIFKIIQSSDINDEIKKTIRVELFQDFEIKRLRPNRCNDGTELIPLKNILITNVMIKAIIKLPSERRGIFEKVENIENIKEKLIEDGFKIIDDNRFDLNKMDYIMNLESVDDFNYPIELISRGNDEYEINNGYHRVTRSLIDGKNDICAIIK